MSISRIMALFLITFDGIHIIRLHRRADEFGYFWRDNDGSGGPLSPGWIPPAALRSA